MVANMVYLIGVDGHKTRTTEYRNAPRRETGINEGAA